MKEPTTSIWGEVQWSTVLAPGIVLVSTASHGGVVLDAQHVVRVPREIEPYQGFRNSWEQDSDVAVPMALFAEEIEAHTARGGKAGETRAFSAELARDFLRDYKPEWLAAIDKARSKGGSIKAAFRPIDNAS